MITNVNPSLMDEKKLKEIGLDKSLLQDDSFDYSKVIVKKPWGYEYLIYQNNFVAVWILFIKKGCQTSMHCHPKKKTSLVLLTGEVICLTLNEEKRLSPGNGLLLQKGVFHCTKSLSDGGSFVMEIETPINKRDLVRLKDRYGREGKGYETQNDFSFDIQNYNYISLIDPTIHYNIKRRFGKCSILIKKFKDSDDFKNNFKLKDWDAISILKGCILDVRENVLLDIGNTISMEDVKSCDNLNIKDETEIMIIKKRDDIVKLSDYIISFFEKENVKDIFAVPGSANVHLLDSLGRNTNMRCIFTQTENAATMAAESYAKFTGSPVVAMISSGSSASNALTGVADSWIDSTPLVIISGQSNSRFITNKASLRQLGIQELNIVDVVKDITKYSVVIEDPKKIKYHLQKAIYIATSGRPGPVWLDIPIDILGMNIDEKELIEFNQEGLPLTQDSENVIKQKTSSTIELLRSSKRPVILAGNGIRLAGSEKEFLKLISLLGVPVLTSRRGADLLSEDADLFFGRSGAYGQRAANFIIQNSDLLISLGSRLSLPQIGRNYKGFARNAKKVIVDVDKAELEKITIEPDIAVNCSVKYFILEMLARLRSEDIPNVTGWINKCSYWKTQYSQDSEQDYSQKEFVNAYYFIKKLSEELNEGDILTIDGGSSIIFVMQAFKFKKGQRLISSTGLENRSFALPGAIGACIGSSREEIICICDDRGFLKSIPELETIISYKLPIKIFILNSHGYSYVRKTQESYFGGRLIGSETKTGTSLDLAKIGEAYNIPALRIDKHSELTEKIREVLKTEGLTICEVNIDKNQQINPRIVFTVKTDGNWVSKPLEDMYPFLDRKTLKEEMFIDLIDE